MILQRVAFYPQERLDIPDARAIEAFGLNDWRFYLKGIMSQKSMIISGFDITNYANIFTVPGVKLQQNNISLIHSEATTQAAGFFVSAGTEADYNLVLNPNTTNFVEVDLSTTSGAADVRGFWDPGANGGSGGEYTDTVDTVVNLGLNILVNVSGFTAGRIPLFKILTDANGKVNSITDCRNMMFRLGTGGTSPDPTASYSFKALPDAAHSRLETASTSTSATSSNNITQGGDKNIRSQKEWMDVVMTQIRDGFSLPFWYMKPQAGGTTGAYQNAALSLLTGGSWSHLGKSAKVVSSTSTTLTVEAGALFDAVADTFKIGTTVFNYTSFNSANSRFSGVTPSPTTLGVPGAIVKQGPFGHIKLAGGSVLVRLGQANSTLLPFADIDLSHLPVLYAILSNDGSSIAYSMGQDGSNPINPKHVSALTTNSVTVPSGGNYKTSNGNLMVRGQKFSYTSYTDSTGLFAGISPDPTGLVASNDMVYQDVSSGMGYYHVSSTTDVPGTTNGASNGAERVFWLAYYDGNDTIYVRDSELIPGESINVGDGNPDQLFTYIGSTGVSDSFPVYNVGSIANGTNLTAALTAAFSIIEKPIYDEIVPDSAMTGWSSGATIYLPNNSRATGNPPGQYTVGTAELVVYENGVLMRTGYDYIESGVISIILLRDVPFGSYFRFRIANIGGAGAAAGGGSAGTTLQNAYQNGATILASPSVIPTFTGPVGQKMAKFMGDIYVQGVIDPTGIQLTPVTSNPLPMGSVGIWTHDVDNSLQFTKYDGSIIPVGNIIEQVGGQSQNFSRTKANNTGATIPAGTAVYLTGNGSIDLAEANIEYAATFFGITAATIPAGSSGPVIYSGVVSGVLAGLGLNTGIYLWLSATPGALQIGPPTATGSHLRIVGIVDGNDLILQPQHNGQLS